MDNILNYLKEHTHKKLLSITAITFSAVIIAGCGGDKEAPDDTEIEEPTTEEETADETTEETAEDAADDSTEDTSEESTEDNAEDTSEESVEEAAEEDESTEESSDDSAEDSSDSGTSEDVTDPGTVLSIGDEAILEHPVNGSDGEYALMGATVTDIEEADPSDLDILDMEDQIAGLVPFYLHITVTGVDEGSSELAGTVLSNPFNGAVDGNQGPAQNLNIIGSFDACNVESLDNEWNADTSQDICVISLVPEGSKVNSVIYSPSDSPYDEDAVIWEE